ncbi:MAG: FKBP-type peptidyl-prolyl cis-trans isomerase [Porphyromonadaceae bacterium]|nr:FKBP-type peptidyl-prolyl cis-trans isomerase [Porphyromonadaceae bacterium]
MQLKSIWPVLMTLALTLGAMGCNDEVNPSLEQRAREERAFHAFKDSSDYTRLTVPGLYGDNYVYAKWLKKGYGERKAKLTDNVYIRYTGYYLTTWTGGRQQGIFETNADQEILSPMSINGTINGWMIALQNMVEGDEIGVAIPWYLGYGAAGKGHTIAPYTSLYFTINLEQIINQ